MVSPEAKGVDADGLVGSSQARELATHCSHDGGRVTWPAGKHSGSGAMQVEHAVK
jgi:hypothetical protein